MNGIQDNKSSSVRKQYSISYIHIKALREKIFFISPLPVARRLVYHRSDTKMYVALF